MEYILKLSGNQHNILKNHLLPGDGKESIAVALCGRLINDSQIILTVHEIRLIANEECIYRDAGCIKWRTDCIHDYFDKSYKNDLALLKIHSHPGGYEDFSDTDDISDHIFFDSAFGWTDNDKPHASAVMLPDGKIFGRFFFRDLSNQPIHRVVVAGDVIEVYVKTESNETESFALRIVQAFGERTYQQLNKLAVGIVGCSGTGSPLIEQLVRLGVRRLVLIDPDVIEMKNLNRILNSTRKDAYEAIAKVEVLKKAIKKIDIGTIVDCFQSNIYDNIEVLKSLGGCDIIFGCVDSIDGRHLLNQLCTYYNIPYFDLGVKLEADGKGGINKICGSVHYIQPGKSSLLTRGVYTMEDVRAAGQYRNNPEEYHNLIKGEYITNVNENSPAVISVNMHIASHAVNEFLNRIHPYKTEPCSMYALTTIDITEGYIVNVAEESFLTDNYLEKKVGRGDVVPFVDTSEIIHERDKKNIA